MSIKQNINLKNKNIILVDDLLATGGTIDCVANLIRKGGKEVIGSVTIVELVELHGRYRFDFPVESMHII